VNQIQNVTLPLQKIKVLMNLRYSVFILTLSFFVMTFYACQHEPVETINGNNGGGNGNGNGNNSLPPCDPDTVYFEQDILPLFISNCTMSGCHNSSTHAEGIDLSSYAAVMSSNVLTPGQAWNSDLVEAITETDPNKIMPPPPMPPMPASQINLIKKWINQGALNLKCDNGCDTTNVTYNGTIKPLLQNSCTGCHNTSSPGGGYNLTNYADDAVGNFGVQSSALNGSLSGSVNYTGTWSHMPKGGSKLPQCQLDQIRIWVDAGAPNN
jgi:hypothetical protein